MPAPALLIANPTSRGGATRRQLPRIEGELRAAIGPFERVWTKGPRDAEHIAREAACSGIRRVVVAGGDGTASEVANGLLAVGLAEAVELAVLPMGTGSDWVRSIGIPRDLSAALSQLAQGRVRSLDAGRVRLCGPDGAPRTIHFVNVASCGLSGLVTERVNRSRKLLPGTLSFLFGTLAALVGYRRQPVRLLLDGAPIRSGPLVLAAAAVGRYFGGGMEIAPEAVPDDGLLDVVTIAGVSRGKVVRELPRVYRGTHLSLDGVSLHRGRRLEILPEADPLLVEADGEPVGRLPGCFEVLPGALRLLGAPA